MDELDHIMRRKATNKSAEQTPLKAPQGELIKCTFLHFKFKAY